MSNFCLYNFGMNKKELDAHIASFENAVPLVPFESDVEVGNTDYWVRLKIDPKRFVPAIFDGEWALTKQHPSPGPIRVIKAITGSDGISRLLARQGTYIYAYPWFK